MGPDDIVSRSIKTSLLVGVVVVAFLAHRLSLSVTWGFFGGVLVSAINLCLLLRLSKTVFAPLSVLSPDQKRVAFFYAALKFPICYGLLILSFYYLNFSVYSFMIGFSVPLFVIFLKTVGGELVKEPVSGDIRRGRRTGIIRSA